MEGSLAASQTCRRRRLWLRLHLIQTPQPLPCVRPALPFALEHMLHRSDIPTTTVISSCHAKLPADRFLHSSAKRNLRPNGVPDLLVIARVRQSLSHLGWQDL
jgi:hypothetical protein